MIQIKKTILTLVALLAVTTGAWADETPLLTIESKDHTTFTSGSKTFDDMVTITFSNEVYNEGDEDGWNAGGTPSLLTVAGINGYTITSCKFYTNEGIAAIGYTVEGESPSVYLHYGEVYTDNSKSVYLGSPSIKKIEVYGAAASSATPVDIDWDAATKTGTFTMPGGNVTLEPEYYPQATLTAAPTAINDVPATTDGAIVKAGTVATIGSTEQAQGTVMYYVSQTALDDAALLALAADQWTADVPTAESLAQGQAYVYYYVRGNDSDTDDETFSDGDILAANALTVTIAAAPTYAVTFAEGTDANEWTASPAADVTKGQPVTVTYTGSKKVLGVKAEKKAKAAGIVNPVVGQFIGSDGKNYDANATLPDGVTKVAKICYVGSDNGEAAPYNHGLALALSDASTGCMWSTSTGSTVHTYNTNSSFASESGLQYNATQNSDTYPAFKAAIANNGTAAPTGCSSWFLASGYQWQKMIGAAGLSNLGLQEDYFWSSTESGADGAWSFNSFSGYWDNSGKGLDSQVRACLAF